jgi:hypothetical protein
MKYGDGEGETMTVLTEWQGSNQQTFEAIFHHRGDVAWLDVRTRKELVDLRQFLKRSQLESGAVRRAQRICGVVLAALALAYGLYVTLAFASGWRHQFDAVDYAQLCLALVTLCAGVYLILSRTARDTRNIRILGVILASEAVAYCIYTTYMLAAGINEGFAPLDYADWCLAMVTLGGGSYLLMPKNRSGAKDHVESTLATP